MSAIQHLSTDLDVTAIPWEQFEKSRFQRIEKLNTFSHWNSIEWQGLSSFFEPQRHFWELFFGHGGHAPEWQVTSHLCSLQDKNVEHFFPQDHVWELQRRISTGDFAQKHVTETVWGQGGQGPENTYRHLFLNSGNYQRKFKKYLGGKVANMCACILAAVVFHI